MTYTKTTGIMLNPYIYEFSTIKKAYVYIPYKQSLFSFDLDEWEKGKRFKVNQKQRAKFLKSKIYVNKNFKTKFLEFYKTHYFSSPQLNIMYIISTDACNFACSYCFIENNFNSEKRHAAKFQ